MSTNDENGEVKAPPVLIQQKSFSELAIERFQEEASKAEIDDDIFNSVACALPETFKGCVFVGHKATDLDSIASAIGAAELFNGTAARASDINSESKFALARWGFEDPAPFLEVCQGRDVCIVDHNQIKQSPDGLDLGALRGCIDHHAIQGGIVTTSAPIYVDIRPWGSACTIIAHMFFKARKRINRNTAGLLLSGILSDTLNLRSPTTTEHDMLSCSILARLAKVDDINELARKLFKAKSQELLVCTPHQLVRGDIKTFECRAGGAPNGVVSLAFGVIETTDLASLVEIRDALLFELRALKKEEKKDMAFLALVDIVNLQTVLLLVGEREVALAKAVFDGPIDPDTGLMSLGKRVSRKKEFIPPIEKALAKGWSMPALSAEEKTAMEEEEFGPVSLECGEHGCQLVRQPSAKQLSMGITSLTITSRILASLAARGVATVHHNCETPAHGPHSYPALDLTRLPSLGSVMSPFKISPPSSATSSSSCSLSSSTIDTSLSTTHAQCGDKRKADDHVSRLPLPAVTEEVKRSPSVTAFSSSSSNAGAMETIPAGLTSPTLISQASMVKRSRVRQSTALSLEDAQGGIRDLIDSADMVRTSELLDKGFTLPSRSAFAKTLERIAAGDDPSLKFLVLALAHSFDKDPVVEETSGNFVIDAEGKAVTAVVTDSTMSSSSSSSSSLPNGITADAEGN